MEDETYLTDSVRYLQIQGPLARHQRWKTVP